MSKDKFDYYIEGEKNKYEVIIGLEVHAQVSSNSKLFSGSATKFGAEPNSQVSLIDSAFPGMLPVINKFCINQAIRTGLGLNAKINNNSVFEHSGQNNGPNTVIQIHDFRCVSNFFLKGDLGWAESYIENLWDTKNLTDFLEWGAKNFHSFSNFIRGKWYIILYLRFKHYLNMNSKKGSQKNIKFHYDLGNDFFSLWLDD